MVSSHWSDDFIPPELPEQPIEELVAEEPASEWSTSRWTVAEEAAFGEPAVEEPVVEESVVEEPAVEEPAVEEPAVEEPAVEEPAVEEPAVEEPAVEEPALEEPAVEERAAEGQAAQEPAETGIAEQLDGSCFRVQVSAKHLVLASPVFKEILKGGWKKSLTYLQTGLVEITADSWDIEALLILLHIVHGRYYQTPRKITLETLAKVAVLVDYYDCREALDILVTTWMNALEETIPKSYSRNLVLWLWVSWSFQLPAQFREATSTAMSWSNNWIDNLGLPIPDIVISKDTHAVIMPD
jgi:hypothetical protein